MRKKLKKQNLKRILKGIKMTRNQRDDTLVIEGGTVINIPEADSRHIAENASENVSITNVAPEGVGTATIAKWLRIQVAGTSYYIPMWT